MSGGLGLGLGFFYTRSLIINDNYYNKPLFLRYISPLWALRVNEVMYTAMLEKAKYTSLGVEVNNCTVQSYRKQLYIVRYVSKCYVNNRWIITIKYM